MNTDFDHREPQAQSGIAATRQQETFPRLCCIMALIAVIAALSAPADVVTHYLMPTLNIPNTTINICLTYADCDAALARTPLLQRVGALALALFPALALTSAFAALARLFLQVSAGDFFADRTIRLMRLIAVSFVAYAVLHIALHLPIHALESWHKVGNAHELALTVEATAGDGIAIFAAGTALIFERIFTIAHRQHEEQSRSRATTGHA
ncbi:MAG: hypothetical protein WCD42_10245 [Rhizomicrobium sp.]